MSNFKLAFRVLARTPFLSLVVMLSLGLGIGANTAIFSLLHQALLRALPVSKPHELMIVTAPGSQRAGMKAVGVSGGDDAVFSYPMLRGLERNPRGLASLAGFRTFQANLAFAGQTISGEACMVSGGFFELLGLRAEMGRLIEPADDRGAGEPVVVLSYDYWQSKLGGRRDVLNQGIRVNGRMFTIVGVAQRGFEGVTLGEKPELFLPITFKPVMTPGWDAREEWDVYWVYLLGRTKPGWSRERAEAELNGAYVPLLEEQVRTAEQKRGEDYRRRLLGTRLQLAGGGLGASQLRDDLKTPLSVLMICAALVLLIAAANAASLMLARAEERRREMAIRTALGAGRRAKIEQVLVEALLLSAGGAALGIILGAWTLDGLVALMASTQRAGETISGRLDPLMLAFTAAVSLATGVLFGIYPAVAAARGGESASMNEAAWGSSTSARGARVRRILVGAQVALSMTLLIPMGLFLKTLVELTRADLGIRRDNLITFEIAPELNGYTAEQSRELFRKIEAALDTMPGSEGATASVMPMISGNLWGNRVSTEGFEEDQRADAQSFVNAVSPGYFGKMGVALVAGREFEERDSAAGVSNAVVNEAFARHFFAGKNPLGRTFTVRQRSGKRQLQIVGVVRDTKYADVREPARRVFYLPREQAEIVGSLVYYVRSRLPLETTFRQIRSIVREHDPDLPVDSLRTMDEQVARNIGNERVILQLSGSFAILATLLAMLGLYGVVSNSVTRRTREIGIRLALGAQTRRIGAMVFGEVGWLTAAGMAVGVPMALWLARYSQSQLYGVEWKDPLIAAAAAFCLALAAAAAAFIPARRAARTSPVSALRHE
ncbi:MAG: ABC transporter permease [Bryobacteraceae bacterium]|nr:ABC transporter permease [Bryobacteraceae bacterium]